MHVMVSIYSRIEKHLKNQGGLTGKVQDIGYPVVPTFKGIKRFFDPKFSWGVFPIISMRFALNFPISVMH